MIQIKFLIWAILDWQIWVHLPFLSFFFSIGQLCCGPVYCVLKLGLLISCSCVYQIVVGWLCKCISMPINTIDLSFCKILLIWTCGSTRAVYKFSFFCVCLPIHLLVCNMFFSELAHYFLLIDCLKLGLSKHIKATEPIFWGKFCCI